MGSLLSRLRMRWDHEPGRDAFHGVPDSKPKGGDAVDVTFKKAPESKKKHGQQKDLAL